MRHLSKKIIKKRTHNFYKSIKKNKTYKKISKLSSHYRSIIGGLIIIIGFLLIATPIPGGLIMIVGFALIFPLKKVISQLKYFINKSGTKCLFTKILHIKHKYFK